MRTAGVTNEAASGTPRRRRARLRVAPFAPLLLPALATGALHFQSAAAAGVDELLAQGRFCSATAQAELQACGHQTLDDYWIAVGVCINESDSRERVACLADAKSSRDEANQLCADQHTARTRFCRSVGEDRYDPPFEPALFERDYAHPGYSNPYFPLVIGSHWEFRSATQSTRVRVLNATKLIDDVRCVVVRDEVSEDGVVIEATNDWFAQAKDGAVWYCGEETAEFATFAGDHPQRPELVSIDGSFKAGRDGDEPGIIFPATPAPGQVYREESSLGNAEDGAQILAVDYAYGKRPELDRMVPPRLAKLLCAGNCVVTKNFSQLEPDVVERKYYAPGIGVFLEIEPASGEVVRLVGCNVDPRCASLPK
jgi:hypothetical protein